MIDLSIITVTHQSEEYIEDLILSVVSGALKLSTEHLIVDNASTDRTVELIEKGYSSYVTLIKNTENVGFSAANNQAYGQARGRYILFLNPDMRLEDGSLDRMVQWMQLRPDVGIASCQLVDLQGDFMAHRAPFSFPKFGRNVRWLFALVFSCSREGNLAHSSEERQVDAVFGAFMLTRKDFLEKLGFAFDPRYFLTYEDVDICREAKRLGYKVMYYPKIRCIDYNSGSFRKKKFLWIYNHVSKGLYIYYRKWEPWYTWMLIAVLRPVGYLIRYFLPKKKSCN